MSALRIDPDAMPPEELARLRDEGYGGLIGKSAAELEAELERDELAALRVELQAALDERDTTSLARVLDVWHEVCPTVNEGEESKPETRLLMAVITLAATVEDLRRTLADSNWCNR